MRRRSVVLLIAVVLTGCAGAPVYQRLESTMKRDITRNHRAVSSVSCTPRIADISGGDRVAETCRVHFQDGTAYTADASISDVSRYNQNDVIRYEWDAPPPPDITRAKLPRPTVEFPADNAASFLHADNLRPTVDAIARRFSGEDAIVALHVFPGEVEAVLVDHSRAQLVTSTAPGQLTVSGSSSFAGDRDAIYVKQLNAEALEGIFRHIARRADVGLGQFDRAELAFLPGDFAGWNIYPRTGKTRFQARLTGSHLIEILPGETRAL